VTELGTFRYPHLSRPDNRFGEDKYKCGWVPLKAEDLDKVEAAVVELAEEVFSKKQLESYTTPIKTDKKDGTRFLEAHTYEMPMVVDAKGKPVKNPEDLRIGGGTIGRLKITLKADTNGNNTYVTAYLNGVQVKKLVEYGAGGFSDISEGDDDAFDAGSVPERERDDNAADDDGEDTDNDSSDDETQDPTNF
jgi:hypothetical protein